MLVWLLNLGLSDLVFGLLLLFSILIFFLVDVAGLFLFNKLVSRPIGSSDLKKVDGPILTLFLGLFIVSYFFKCLFLI